MKEKQLGPDSRIIVDGDSISGVQLKNISLIPRNMTHAERAMLDCIAGRRAWDKPLDAEVNKDVSSMLDPQAVTPLTRLEHTVMNTMLTAYLSANAGKLSELLHRVAGKQGAETAVKSLVDVAAFESMQKEHGIRVGDAESSEYWMEALVGGDVRRLHQRKPVAICDWGAATGRKAVGIKKEFEPKVSTSLTDIGYGPHYPVGRVYRITPEATLRQMNGAFDVSMAVYSIRHSPFPQLAVRNILDSTRHSARLTFEDYAGVGTTARTLPDALRNQYLAHVTGVEKPPGDLTAILTLVDGKVREELMKAQETGFKIMVSTKNSPPGEPEFKTLKELPKDKNLYKIIATR